MWVPLSGYAMPPFQEASTVLRLFPPTSLRSILTNMDQVSQTMQPICSWPSTLPVRLSLTMLTLAQNYLLHGVAYQLIKTARCGSMASQMSNCSAGLPPLLLL